MLDAVLGAEPGARLGPVGLRVYRGYERPTDINEEWGEMIAAYETETIAGNIAARFGFGVLPGIESGENPWLGDAPVCSGAP